MAKQELTCDDILKELRAKQYRPVYYLMGEEDYYIDLIAGYIEANVLTDEEKEFNQTVVYGADVDIATIINAAKRYPMMAEHQVVIVREAQAVRGMEELAYYLQKPLRSTILVLCHKHGVLDRRKKLAGEIEKAGGVVFESKKVREAQHRTEGLADGSRIRGYRPEPPDGRAGKVGHYAAKRFDKSDTRTGGAQHRNQQGLQQLRTSGRIGRKRCVEGQPDSKIL